MRILNPLRIGENGIKHFRQVTFPGLLVLATALVPVYSCGSKRVEEATQSEVVTSGQDIQAPVDTDPEPSQLEESADRAETEIETPAFDADESQQPGSGGETEENWFLVAEITEPKFYKVYVDTTSLREEEGGRESLARMVFFDDQKDSDGMTYREVHIVSVIDCPARTYSYKSSKFFDGLGKMVYQENIGENESEITENSVSAHIADFVCGYEPPEPLS